MYPLKFSPVFQKRIWGGRQIQRVLGRAVPQSLAGEPVGESWEIADLPPGSVKADSAGAMPDGSLSSIITGGPLAGLSLHQALERHSADILGGGARSYFPLLIKYLDANEDLSVQVHPNEAYAKSHPGAHLKSEAWYVLAARPGAKIYKGLRPGTTRQMFADAVRQGNVAQMLNAIPVRAGDCHYLESGTVHALGAGVLAAEVQTPSDTTFRVFDWNRLGPDGKPRDLHIDAAMQVISFDSAPDQPVQGRSGRLGDIQVTDLVSCRYFSISRRTVDGGTAALPVGPAAVWILLAGQGVLEIPGESGVAVAAGDTVLVPAKMEKAILRVVSPCSWLQADLPG